MALTYQQIADECKLLEIPLEQLCDDLGIHRSKISRWRKQQPQSILDLQKIEAHLYQCQLSRNDIEKNFARYRDRVYISGKITGDEANARKRFNLAEAHLRSQGYREVVNPCTIPMPDNVSWEQAMALCLARFYDCNKIYMLKGWEDSKGASIEHMMAIEMNKQIFYQK